MALVTALTQFLISKKINDELKQRQELSTKVNGEIKVANYRKNRGSAEQDHTTPSRRFKP